MNLRTVDKLLPRLNSLVPDFVQSESPEFIAFLKAYFEFLEQETIVLKSQSIIDNLGLEDGSGDILFETATISPSTSSVNKILMERTTINAEQDADPFTVGEYVVGLLNNVMEYVQTV